jgi:cytochrome c
MRLPMILVAAICAVSVGQARAQDIDLAAQGRALVKLHCARCHAIDKDDASKLPIAPPLRELASKWPVENLEEAFAEGLVTGHPDMPVFQFEDGQISAIIEHLHAISDRASNKAQ